MSLNGKEQELTEEARKYRLDVLGISSIKAKGTGSMDLNRYKLFYSRVDPDRRAMAGVGILVSNRMAECVVDFTPVNMRTCILKVKVEKLRVNFIQVYAQNKEEECEAFIEELEHALDQLVAGESIVMLGDFNEHVGDDPEKWEVVIGRHGNSSLNQNGLELLRLCIGNGLTIIHIIDMKTCTGIPVIGIPWHRN